MAFSMIIMFKVFVDHRYDRLTRIHIGEIFCHVLRVNNMSQLVFDMTGGIHMWQGALPSFVRIENMKIHNDKDV